MKIFNLSKALIRCSVATATLGAGHGALAHTSIRAQATEATTSYNDIVIGHGCEEAKLPVIAQSVVFPTLHPTLTISAGTFAGGRPIFQQTTFAGIPQLIQSKDIFTKQTQKTDAQGNVIGFTSTEGSLSYTGDPAMDLLGHVPFRTGGVNFNAASCAKKLVVEVAIADICEKNGAHNLWIPSVTPKFPDPTVDGIGEPATLVFNRDLTKNPFLASSNCGDGYEVTLSPSVEDIDTNLPIPGYLDGN